jgi:hypothetical protein
MMLPGLAVFHVGSMTFFPESVFIKRNLCVNIRARETISVGSILIETGCYRVLSLDDIVRLLGKTKR